MHRRWKFSVVLAGAMCFPALAPPSTAPPAAPPDATSALRDAARELATERAGFTAFHRHFDAEQHAPGHDASVVIESARLRDGDRIDAVRVYSQVTNGQAAAPEELANAQTDVDKNSPTDDYVLPLTEGATADYQLAAAPCDRCDPGFVAIHFTSVKRDDRHGDGTVIVDGASHHIASVAFVPCVLAAHADSATVTMTFGRVLPDLWDVTGIEQHYLGHVLFIHGGADVTTTLTAYRRFTTRDEGLKALASGI